MKRASLLVVLAAATLVLIVDAAEAGKKKRRYRLGVNVQLGVGHRPHPQRPAGHHEWREQRVWVPAGYEIVRGEGHGRRHHTWRTVSVRLPDRYEWRTERVWVDGGTTWREERYLLRPGRWEMRWVPGQTPPVRRVWVPPYYGTRRVAVQVPGHWEVRRRKVRIPGGYTMRRERVVTARDRRHGSRRVWRPGRYEVRRIKVWVPGAAYVPRRTFVIGGNHGGFGFSLNLSGR